MSILEKIGLFESKKEDNEIKFKLYVDMDGVLTNWFKAFRDLGKDVTKGLEGDEFEKKYGREELWSVIDKHGKLEFWSEMEWMKNGKNLWNYVKKYNPTILTTPAKNKLSKQGKEIWIKRELGKDIPFIFAKDKYKYADMNSILIDDYDKKINDWVNLGDGIGILYKSVDQVIEELKKYGL
jgi:hypothetical protein